MEGYFVNAASLGMNYIRFTDHDNRIGYKQYPFTSFDFSKGQMMYEDYPGKTCGFDVVGEPQTDFCGDRMILSASDEGGVKLTSSGKRHTVSLLADVTLILGVHRTNGSGRVVIDIKLSQHPCICDDGTVKHQAAHMKYVLGKARDGELSLTPTADGIYNLNISKDVHLFDVGGLDNAFDTISIIAKDGASCELFHLSIERKCPAQEVLNRQRKLANEIGSRYGIKPFVTTEISAAGHHKCCYGEQVPVIDYAAHDYLVSQEDAIAHVKSHGGIFSYNHPFDSYKRIDLAEEEKPIIVMNEAEALCREKVFGASLIEVGFPAGRHGFAFRDYMKLWDTLSLAGIFITGHGDNDSHTNDTGWFGGNNFAAYIAAPSELSFPIDDSFFIESMKAGRVYSANPVYVKGNVSFECEGVPMGAILRVSEGDGMPRKMRFCADLTEPGWRLSVICNGEPTYSLPLEDTSVDFEFEVLPVQPLCFARVELYNSDGRCILMTNPIYIVRGNTFADALPPERLYEI